MNISQIHQSTKTPTITVSDSNIIHIVPEFGTTVADLIYTSGIRLINCEYFVSTAAPIKLGSKVFNARTNYIYSKNKLTSKMEEKHKTLKIVPNIPDDFDKMKQNKQFAIIDHTVISQAVQHMLELTNPKQATFFLFQQLKKEFIALKTKSSIENNLMFLFPKLIQKNSILELLNELSILPNSYINDNCKTFDKFILASIPFNEKHQSILPISLFDTSGNIKILKQNIAFIDTTFKDLEKDQENNKEQELKIADNKELTPKTFSDTINIGKELNLNKSLVNHEQLSKILRKYKVRDRAIAENIKATLDEYLSNAGDKSQENLENIILHAINKSIFGSDEIDEEYLHNPAKLFRKLEEVNIYHKDIVIPKDKRNVLEQPNEIISLEKVTGLIRHEYEFTTNIHNNVKQLFKSLESKPQCPIKLVKITPNYQDNDLNRFIDYEVTLQNMAEGDKNPYTVNIKVPALVNSRYFKLNGKNYVLSNQQIFAPVTKTTSNECRFIGMYATMTLTVINMKMNLSEVDRIIEYISVKYPSSIVTLDRDKNNKIIRAIIKDVTDVEHTINLYDNIAYISNNSTLYLDDETGKWIFEFGDIQQELSIGKSEFLYDKLVKILQGYNPQESLRKSPKSIPYIEIFLSGIKLPLIIYLWQQLGLIDTLKKLAINFEITAEPPTHEAITLSLDNSQFLHIYPTSKRELLILNGLLLIDRKKYSFTINDLKDKSSIDQFIIDKCGTRSLYQLDLNTMNMVDPVTKELLEYQDKPTNLVDLTCKYMIEKLLNDPADSITDLKLYRSRQAEIMFQLLYKALMMAHSKYVRDLQFNKDAKIFLKPEYVIECLLGVHPHTKGSSVLELAQPFSPIAELKAASKLIKTGPSGVPSSRSFKKEHRGIHPSYYGNIG